MELKKILDSRRSTRKFLPRKVEHDKLQRIVDMALQAPSSRNTRSTRLLVVEKPEQLEKIASMRDYGSAFVKDAPAAIIVAGDRDASDLWLDNCAITATTLQLAAVDEGLASCWVHVNARPASKTNPTVARPTTTCASSCPSPSITAYCASWRWLLRLPPRAAAALRRRGAREVALTPLARNRHRPATFELRGCFYCRHSPYQ